MLRFWVTGCGDKSGFGLGFRRAGCNLEIQQGIYSSVYVFKVPGLYPGPLMAYLDKVSPIRPQSSPYEYNPGTPDEWEFSTTSHWDSRLGF